MATPGGEPQRESPPGGHGHYWDRSSVTTGYREGASGVLPMHTKRREGVEALAMLKVNGGCGGWGTKSAHPLKGGARKVLPCLEGGHTKFRTRDFPIL